MTTADAPLPDILRRMLSAARHLGWRWLAFRLRYALFTRFGLLERRCPVGAWDEIPTPSTSDTALGFIPDVATHQRHRKVLNTWDHDPAASGDRPSVRAEDAARGRFTCFDWKTVDLGSPPDWDRNVLVDAPRTPDRHWSRLGEFSFGDVKGIWEVSRFSWAFSLSRAYARTGSDAHAETFWRLFEDWLDAHPPNVGVQWKCGQEATFRLIACSFARGVLRASPATTPARLQRFARFVAFTGHRIAGNLSYALSQDNNHGISECVGLLTAARLLPGFPPADGWARTAITHLRDQVERLIYPDGAFSQHSTVYHRLVLSTLCWHAAVEMATGHDLAPTIAAAGRRATAFLAGMTDPRTGMAPMRGPNDGANVLPLSTTDYLDFRPACQCAAVLFEARSRFAQGPWDEAVFWLNRGHLTPTGKPTDTMSEVPRCRHGWRRETPVSRSATGPPVAVSPAEAEPALRSKPGPCQSDRLATQTTGGGWHMLRGDDVSILLVAPKVYRHRPGHSDLLHVEVMWRGHPIAISPGTWSYNASGGQWADLNASRNHNTVTIDGQDQMQRASRFLYVPWPKLHVDDSTPNALIASHAAYRRFGVIHRRRVTRTTKGCWLVEDLVGRRGSHPDPRRIRLHWLLAPGAHVFDHLAQTLSVRTPAGQWSLNWEVDGGPATASVVVGEPTSSRGWWSPRYHLAREALSLAVEVRSESSVVFRSWFQFD